MKLWGFVDHGNLYGDAGAKEILQEWWGGGGSDAGTWRFNLKGGVTALRLAAAQHHRAIVQLLRARGAE